jgi:hypothetical protein
VYGTPYVTPGYSTADVVATGVIAFGAGLAIGAMMSGGCCGWGYSSWNCNWHGGGAYYHGAAYLRERRLAWRLLWFQCIRLWAIWQRPRLQWLQPLHRHLCARRVNFNSLRHTKGRTGVQPIHGSLWRHPSRFQRLFELGKLDVLEERSDCRHTALFGC